MFYDFEVLSNCKDEITGRSYWCVVFIDYDSKKGKIIKNNEDELRRFYNLTKEYIYVGYNCRSYDQHIFKGLLLGMDAGYVNDKLIVEGKKGFEIVRDGFKIPFNNFDIMPNPPIGLKTLEGFMGSNIKESSVPFNIDRPLTDEEEKDLIRYCAHDVKETVKVFDIRRAEFDSQLAIIDTFDLSMNQFNKTKAQLAGFTLGAEKHPHRGDEFDMIVPDTLVLNKYKHVIDWYMNPENHNYKAKLKFHVKDSELILGYGGAHAAIPKYNAEGIILCADVASLYPSLMIEYGFMSRNVKDKDKYKLIRDERLRLKALKDPRQQPMKIILNSTYGALKDKFNPLYDPLQANNVCLAGQLLLLDLVEKVEDLCVVNNINTDGLFMTVKDRETVDKIKEIAAEWEKRTRLDLEWEEFSKIYQKDVNNYIIINDKGKYKSKGAWLKSLDDLDYDLPIVNKALVNYFTKNVPLEETINNCNELREFQKLVKVSSKYLYGLHGEERLYEKVLRVFADNRENAKGVFKVKLKMKDGLEQEVPEKIGNTPDKCFIDNDDIKGVKVPTYLDKNYYVELAKERLNNILGIPNRKKKKSKKDEQKNEK
ncbi:hypothetical protein IC621_02485 [Bacillus sp. IB182487]|uniref:DNA-directed DNA polymerase n=2 Tax=Metabacillus arenae TaxID=2771434 RepID=A0A926N804_9BACI|nr:hypothetical protein [Metabacillus arenae]